MKIVIVGGGIAGLSCCMRLRKLGHEAVILERAKSFAKIGQGFVLLPNGMNVLKALGFEEVVNRIGTILPKVSINAPSGRLITESYLVDHIGVTRHEFVDMLLSKVKPDWIRMGCEFGRFDYDDKGNVKSVICENGHEEKADVVIAADGVRSPIRKILFPDKELNPVRIKEFVGIIEAPDIVDYIGNAFRKIQDEKYGLSMGMVPSGQGRLIWFVQYDSEIWDTKSKEPEVLRRFTEKLIENWPYPAQEIIDRTDFETIHHWYTCDMDPLQKFYAKNIVLIGDACHPMLTFTSQGANSALVDSMEISEALRNQNGLAGISQAFKSYQAIREKNLLEYLLAGRNLAQKFLHPQKYIGQEELPLVK